VKLLRDTNKREGMALVIVLLVLLALLVMATPFLMMARRADQTSAQLADRTEAKVALDTAARHGRFLLSESHAAVDRTPYVDSLDELVVDNRFDAEFLNANDPNGTMWDVDAEDVAGRIDLNSAGPHVLANVAGLSTRLVEMVDENAKALRIAHLSGLEPTGIVWMGGELIRYEEVEDNTLAELTRGFLSRENAEGEELDGPRKPMPHGLGAPILDQRAFGPVLWRMQTADGELRTFDTPEDLLGAAEFMLMAILGNSEEAGVADRAALASHLVTQWSRLGTVHGGLLAGRVWQRAARLTSKVEGGVDGRVRLDSVRWLNPGATIRIDDGAVVELAVVQSVERSGLVRLDRVLEHTYEAYTAEVRVLARRPVNVNTAPADVLRALFLNLQLAGRNARITSREADQLAALVIASRPFTGHEDFLRRVVLPAAGLEGLPQDAPVVPDSLADGAGFIDTEDALALYLNARNSNDGWLVFSTMPLCYSSRDVFELDLRATINGQNGVQRQTALRETVELIVPQQELLSVWARQEDFDEVFRLDREAPGWMTGPNATSRHDYGASPPRRVWAHMGTFEGEPFLPGVTPELESAEGATAPRAEHVFASTDVDGYAQLWPSRLPETDRLSGRVVHFDHETRDPEGRYLPDEPLLLSTDDDKVAWTDPDAVLLRSFSISFWVKPRQVAGATLFDVGGSDLESDRVSLHFEEGDLVLRVLDGTGDHRDTAFVEAGEVRFALAPGEDPGLPLDTWSHISIDVHGNRPDQMTLLVNGMTHGVRTPGLTTLTSAVSLTSSILTVESTEGFPPRCCVRVGNELIEVRVTDSVTLRAEHTYTGPEAGFGGRQSRVEFATDDPASGSAELNPGDHPAGTPVTLYGYSLPLDDEGVPAGSAQLPSELGPFRAAVMRGVVGGSQSEGEPILMQGLLTSAFGMQGDTSSVTGLVLRSADDLALPVEQFMDAFDRRGGYAAIAQIAPAVGGAPGQTMENAPVGGVEVIRYSSWVPSEEGDAAVLQIVARGHVVAAELPNYAAAVGSVGGSRAFVTDWGNISTNDGSGWTLIGDRPSWRAYVVPISIAVPNATGLAGFVTAQAGDSEFAQITQVDSAELTEWVRYDWFDENRGFLVRDDVEALDALRAEAAPGGGGPQVNNDPQGPGGPGGPGGGGGGGQAVAPKAVSAPSTASASTTSSVSLQSQNNASLWTPNLGGDDAGEESFPRSRAFGDALQHRGVLGTSWHRHPIGTEVLPVFGVLDRGPNVGRPGRLDASFLVAATPDHIGWPVIVHRAHKPSDDIVRSTWNYETETLVTATVQQRRFDLLKIRVGLQDRAPEPIPGGPIGGAGGAGGGTGGTTTLLDSRTVGRLTLFPSGERPRIAVSTALGGVFNGSAGGIPAAVVDEVAFGNARFAEATQNREASAGGQLIVAQAFSAADNQILTFGNTIRLAGRLHPRAGLSFLQDCPEDAGLLRIGNEILAYDNRDTSSNTFTVAAAGRGLLGTEPTPHAAGEPITFLEHIVVSALSGDVGAGNPLLPIKDTTAFPQEGTVLIGDELIHYTALRESGLWMPARSTEPGAMDGRGDGIFRGRYGTQPSGHAAGEVVIVFPFRYWDRWAEDADAPELHYFGFSIDQPAAFWRSVFWTAEDASGAARVGVLQRTDQDVAWDADPDSTPGLELYWSGTREGDALPVGEQSDRIEWRVLVEYRPNSFDARTGLQHGWKETPRLRQLGAFFLAPSMTLRSIDR
jgi:hypothetical protein